MIANFIDFLTVPLISLGIPLSIWILYKSREENFEKAWLKVIIASICWLIGYAGAWIAKWAQYDLTMSGVSMINIGFSQTFYRMERENKVGFYDSIVRAIIDCISRASICTIAMGIAISFFGKLKEKCIIKKHITFAFLLILLMPLTWYVVLANHTLLHAFFVYRCSVLFALGALLAFYCAFFEQDKTNEQKKT